MSDGHLLVVGGKWDDDVFSIPSTEPSFGWQDDHTLVIGDPYGELSVDDVEHQPIQLGFAQHGPLAVVAMRAPGHPEQVMESPRPWLIDADQTPELDTSVGDHILWKIVYVRRGVIAALRAFTTGPEVTDFLQRVYAEQRQIGRLTYQHADWWIADWQHAAPTLDDVWDRCEVYAISGD